MKFDFEKCLENTTKFFRFKSFLVLEYVKLFLFSTLKVKPFVSTNL